MGEENAPARRPEGHTLCVDGSIVFEEFEEGDPRRGPHSLSVQIEAEAWARTPGRWHQRRRHVDWFAIRLTVGRGYASPRAGRMFGVEDSNIRKRARDEKWVSPMAECDRRELSVWVWLAGWRRLDQGDADSRVALKKTSEWRLRQEKQAVWREKNRQGEQLKFTINDEIPDDAYFSDADSKREERRSLTDKLEAKLGELESELRERVQSRRRAGPDTQDRAAESADRVDAIGSGVDEPVRGVAGVACVGATDTASS